MFSLKGQKALVTGATGGLGRAIAIALHTQGAEVAISGRRAEVLENLRQELGSDRVHVLPADLGDKASLSALIPSTVEAMGGIDILVNNAGITKDGLAMRMKDEDFETVIHMNLFSAFQLSRDAIRHMLKNKHGRIINIASIVGVTGNPGQANYCASKAGLIGMTKSIAAEIATRGITVNCIAPGFISSPMTDVLPAEQKAKLEASIPLGRMGEGADIAAAAVYLASLEASYVTGQTIHVNGGMAMI